MRGGPVIPLSTSGQLQGLRQLAAFAQLSQGVLTIVGSGHEKADGSTGAELRVIAELHVGAASAENAGQGRQLRDRESMEILVPPDFPFRHPSLLAAHYDFTGLPHVQWGRSICLYASDAEWDPADGMNGFVDRLTTFYEHIWKGTLDGPLVPWHPPAVYTAHDTLLVVVNADIPPDLTRRTTTPGVAVGVAVLIGGRRVDIERWVSLSSDTGPEDTATALEQALQDAIDKSPQGTAFLSIGLVLPSPIGFEYPTDLADLLNRMEELGANLPHLLTTLVASLNANLDLLNLPPDSADDVPMLLVLRAPGDQRSIGHDDRAVFAAWQLSTRDLAASGVVRDASASPPLPAVASTIPVSWATVYDNRRSVVSRRDDGRPVNWLADRRILLLGCGALGAPIAEHCLRAGARALTLLDRGAVTPGLLVRQPYNDADIGFAKTEALGQRLKAVAPGCVITSWPVDALADGVLVDAHVSQFDVVIDATANRTVAHKIEAARKERRRPWPPLLSVAIGHRADRGIVTVSPPSAIGAGTDILRRVARQALDEPTLIDVLDDFFPINTPELFHPDNCSDPTFIGSATDVNALAAELLDQGLLVLQKLDPDRTEAAAVPPMAAASVVRRGGPNPGAPAASPMQWHGDLAIPDRPGRYEARIEPEVLHQLRAAVIAAHTRAPGAETGGILLGQFNSACHIVWISEAMPAPPGSFETPGSIRLNISSVHDLVDDRCRSSRGVLHFVGMWHTHPGGQAAASSTDVNAMGELVTSDSRVPRAVLVVVGGNASLPRATDPAIDWPEDLFVQVFP
jgi:integrative and conjugative element protein (TIGR02256 family)